MVYLHKGDYFNYIYTIIIPFPPNALSVSIGRLMLLENSVGPSYRKIGKNWIVRKRRGPLGFYPSWKKKSGVRHLPPRYVIGCFHFRFLATEREVGQ